MPHLGDNNVAIKNPITSTFNDLVSHCKNNNMDLVVGADCNAHSKIWGDKKNDERGDKIIDFITTVDLSLLNSGSKPTLTTH